MWNVTLTSWSPPGGGPPEPLAVAATGLGVVRVVSGAGAAAAQWDETGGVPEDWVEGIRQALGGDWRAGHAVPIDWDALPATDLERRIFHHLRGLPPAETTTLADVAEAVTTDTDEAVGPLPAPADVAAACRRNPLPALVPCGRVLPGPPRPAPPSARPRPRVRDLPGAVAAATAVKGPPPAGRRAFRPLAALGHALGTSLAFVLLSPFLLWCKLTGRSWFRL